MGNYFIVNFFNFDILKIIIFVPIFDMFVLDQWNITWLYAMTAVNVPQDVWLTTSHNHTVFLLSLLYLTVPYCQLYLTLFNTLRPRQNGHRFPDDTFKCIFLNENVRISIKISLKFVPKGPINNSPALDQIMAWRRSGAKLLSEPMMVSLLTHVCVTQPQWVNTWPGRSTNQGRLRYQGLFY